MKKYQKPTLVKLGRYPLAVKPAEPLTGDFDGLLDETKLKA